MEEYGDEGFIQLLRGLREEARDAESGGELSPAGSGEADIDGGGAAQAPVDWRAAPGRKGGE